MEHHITGIWIDTREPDEADREIKTLCAAQNWTAASWDCAQGIWEKGDGKGDPVIPLKLTSVAQSDPAATHLTILHNYHLFLKNPVVMQSLFNAVKNGKAERSFFIVLAPSVQLPPELEKVFVVIDHPLPDANALRLIANELIAGDHDQPTHLPESTCVAAASGLTRYEAEGAFALSLVQHDAIQPDTIWNLKAQLLQKSGLLELHRGMEKFADLGGLAALKGFCTKALTPNPGSPVRPKGVMLLGVPGTGKSAFAKALGNEVGRPTLTLDVGSLYGSLVGETEGKIRQALKIADAMAPCVLFIDEIEKALSGVGSNGDSGVATRLFGTLLTWLSDHTSDVFVIATSNDVSKLPPEFSRAERWDGIFFIDLPSSHERSLIWTQYTTVFSVKEGFGSQEWEDSNWTGAEIKSCCRLAALLAVPLREAAKNVVPVAVTAADKVQSLREWASNRCLSASSPGIYHHEPKTPKSNHRRNIAGRN